MCNLTSVLRSIFFPLSVHNSAARVGKQLALLFASFSALFCLLAGISAQTKGITAISAEFSSF
jgi:hypothetical protein